jgi:hypothetical protein
MLINIASIDAVLRSMSLSRLCNPKVCALVAATLILPALVHADRDHDKGDRDRNEDRGGDRDRDDRIPVVPEASAGWVLIPFIGAVLLFSCRQFSRAKA